MARPSSKKDIKEIPFATIRQEYVRAVNEYKDIRARQYAEFLLSKEAEWTATHEAPYEGNFSDQYPDPKLTQSELDAVGFKGVAAVLPSLGIKAASKWLMPQLLNYLNETVVFVRTAEGKIDGRATVINWVAKDQDKHLGMLYVITFPTRSAVVSNQTSEPDSSSLVPLFLAAFKKYRNINYSEWDRDTLSLIVAEPLLKAMLCGPVPDITTEQLLQLRVDGKLPTTHHKLLAAAVNASPLAGLPDNAVAMLTQIWVASPELRTKYMVLDPDNWDAMPAPLVSINLFSKYDTTVHPWQTTMPEPKTKDTIPWSI